MSDRIAYIKDTTDGTRPPMVLGGTAWHPDVAASMERQGYRPGTEAEYWHLMDHGRPAPVRRPHLLTGLSTTGLRPTHGVEPTVALQSL